jgi:hypothetical protein
MSASFSAVGHAESRQHNRDAGGSFRISVSGQTVSKSLVP